MSQIILNLLSNAVKYTAAETGKVDFRIAQKPSSRGGGYVQLCICVKDNGIGMAPGFQKHLFEPFAREDRKRVGKIQGAGLGMVITKQNIDLMEGSISVQSKVDVGTEFHVVIDVERAANEKELRMEPRSILVMDEPCKIGKALQDMLHGMGASADVTQDPYKVPDMLREAFKAGKTYDAILWNDNDRDSDERRRLIRGIMESEFCKDTEFWLMIKDWLSWRDRAKELGIEHYIEKPVFPSDLYQAFGERSAKKEQSREQILKQDLNILVAEDNEINREILKMLLDQISQKADYAENGKVCVELFQKSPPGYYDLILMDIRMPEMDGYEATEIIRGLNRADAKIPIIAITADMFDEDVRKGFEKGMNEYVAKPIDFDELVRKINLLLQ